jgi:hypothetical protein
MSAQLEIKDTEVRDACEEITVTLEGAYDLLLERREIALAAASESLDEEEQLLRQEYGDIHEARVNLERLLPATAREAARKADALTVAGEHEAAQVKLFEAEEAANAPKAMANRQREISARIEAIDEERKNAARSSFETWLGELHLAIRAAEHGLFIGTLDKARDEMYAYQERHGLQGTIDNPYASLIKDHHLSNLTAPDRTMEWNSGTRWYSGNWNRNAR